ATPPAPARRRPAQTRRTRARLRPGRRGADEIDEDLVQRGLHQLEARQARPRPDEFPEDLLRVGPGGELQFGILTVVVNLLHKCFVSKYLRCSSWTAVEPDGEMLSAMCRLVVAYG